MSLGVLREIVDPSHKIDPKFAMQVVITIDGKIVTGIVASEDKDTISMIVNPEAPEPTVIKRDDIDEIEKSSKSLMPKAFASPRTRFSNCSPICKMLNRFLPRSKPRTRCQCIPLAILQEFSSSRGIAPVTFARYDRGDLGKIYRCAS